jgi:hypothetical protein
VAALENAALALDFVFCVQARRCAVFSFCQLLGPLEVERPPGPALLSHVPPSNGPRSTFSDLVIAEELERQVRKDAHDMAGRHRIFARASRRSGITGRDFQYMTIFGRFGDRKGRSEWRTLASVQSFGFLHTPCSCSITANSSPQPQLVRSHCPTEYSPHMSLQQSTYMLPSPSFLCAPSSAYGQVPSDAREICTCSVPIQLDPTIQCV